MSEPESGDPFDKFDDEDATLPRPPTTDEVLANLDKELVSPMRQQAMAFHQLFLDYQAAGFTEPQALHLTGVAVTTQMQINAAMAMRRMQQRGEGESGG